MLPKPTLLRSSLLQSRIFYLILFLCGWSSLAEAGVVKGRVTDEKGRGLPFATVYVRGTTNGSTTNEQGDYQLTIEPGGYILVFQFVGYKTQLRSIEIKDQQTEPLVVDVQLQMDAYQLNEVKVTTDGKDPAYAIMRQAIARRDYHLKEVQAYTAQVYMKGLQRLINVPKRVMGVIKVPAGLKPGILYLSESVSELNFRQPNKYRERMISSKVSGSSRAFSFNQASQFNLNFYQNLIDAQGINQRGFVSPLAKNAMMFYRYELLSSSQNNGNLVHRIKVTPIRKHDPVVAGEIYIVDDSWRLQSLNLFVTKDQQIEFVDTLRITQQFAPAQGNVWVLQSQKLTFDLEGYGFKGNGYFTAVYSKYRVQPAPFVKQEPAPAPAVTPTTSAVPERPIAVVAPAPEKKPKRINKAKQQEVSANGVPDEEFFKKKEILAIEKEANRRDSAYWAEIRPVPLTVEEVKDYHTKDSLQVIKESKPYRDSVDQKNNKFSASSLFLGGYTYRNSFERRNFNIDPITRIWQYNTVEGLVGNLRLGYYKYFEDSRNYSITPTIRYGFKNKEAQAKLAASFYYDPIRRASIGFEGGRFVSQFNASEPITPFVNTVYSLLEEENYLKLYQREYFRLNHSRELFNGLRATFMLDYSQRSMMHNHTSYTWRDDPDKEFTSNEPLNAEVPTTAFPRNQALTFAVAFSFKPGQEYISHPDRKINLDSKWPTFNLNFRKGIHKVFGSDVNYNFLSVGVRDDLHLGLVGTSTFSASVGTFLGKKQMYFMDFRHFEGNRTILSGDFSGFQLLDYYRYSTQHSYIEGHYQHHFNGFILNKVPLLRRLKWQEVGSVNYLRTKESGHYLEVGVGLEHVFKVFRIDFFTGFQEQHKVSSGLRIGYGF